MKKRNIERIYSVLEKDSRLVDEEGKLLKNKVQELAQKMDSELLRLILNDDYCKSLFIQDVDGIQVFDKDKFCWVVNSKDFLPDGFTKYKNAILLTDENGNSIKKSSDVVLEFPFKDCYLEADSTKDTDEREEVFYNETLMKSEIDTLLAPKAFCNAKKYDSDGEHKVTSITDKDNLIIKGNNLLALHSLVPKYKGQIKLMYWDVLYNTESDKVPYADSFKHTSWLTMMKNRLEVAKTLLKDDGVICIQCDDNEQAYLKVLCDEVFGRGNFLNSIAIKMSTPSGLKLAHRTKKVIKTKEWILIYCINKDKVKINPQYIIKDEWDEYYEWYLDNSDEDINNWIVYPLKDILQQNNIELDMHNPEFKKFYLKNADKIWSRGSAGNIPKEILEKSYNDWEHIFKYELSDNEVHYCYKGRRMAFLNKTIHPCFDKDGKITTDISTLLCDLWTDISTSSLFSEGHVSLNNGKKPELLLYRIVSMFSDEHDIILDAYLGSGTTADVVHKLKRQYIGIEQLDNHIEKAVKRLEYTIGGGSSKVADSVNWQGGGSFIYCELAKNSQNNVDQITAAQDSELPAIYDQLLDSPFLSYKVDIQEMEKQKGSFTELTPDDQRKLLISILDKNTLYVNYSDMDDEDYALSDNDKAFTKSFYSE